MNQPPVTDEDIAEILNNPTMSYWLVAAAVGVRVENQRVAEEILLLLKAGSGGIIQALEPKSR